MSDETAVYRIYDDSGDLLYVGLTNNPKGRFKQHAKDKPWWPTTGTVKVTWYHRRPEAELREQQAIAEEGPRFNRALPPWLIGIGNEQWSLHALHREAQAAALDAMDSGTSVEALAEASGWSPRYLRHLAAHPRSKEVRSLIAKRRDGKVTE